MKRLLVVWTALALLIAAACGDDPPAEEQPVVAQGQEAAGSEAPAEAESERAQAEAEQEAQPSDDASSVMLAEAAAASRAWSDGVETIVLDTLTDVALGALAFEFQMTMSIQLSPLTAHAVLIGLDLFGGTEQQEAAADLLDGSIELIITEGSLFLRLPEADGWIDAGADADGALAALPLGIDTDVSALSGLDQFDQTFACVDAAGGVIVEDTYEGEDVWIVECEVDVDAISEAVAGQLADAGLGADDLGYESMHQRLILRRPSGRAVLVENTMTLSDAEAMGLFGGGDESPVVRTVMRVISVNEPLTLPDPVPLIDIDAFEAMEEEPSAQEYEPAPLPTAAELLALAAGWQAAVDEIAVGFSIEAEIDGEQRRASGVRKSSRSGAAFETEVEIDDSGTHGLLWTSDGAWTVSPGGVWMESSAVALGFGSLTVEQFLANPDRLNLSPLGALADDAASIARTEIGGRPTEYEVGFYEFGLEAGDERFEAIANILKAEIAELVGDGVGIERIEIFEATLTLQSSEEAEGMFVSLVIYAEFESSAGWVYLNASRDSLNLDGAPLLFSEP